MSLCPCGSGESYEACCGRYISGAEKAPTAEAMMRSRYTAHTLVDMDYIINTQHPETRDTIDVPQTRKWAKESEWLGLDVRHTEVDEAGGGDKAIVEFVATYRHRGELQTHHEVSLFHKVNDEWYFLDARAPKVQQVRREEPKVGRNDPCPCGSGKKYKKCCGKAA